MPPPPNPLKSLLFSMYTVIIVSSEKRGKYINYYTIISQVLCVCFSVRDNEIVSKYDGGGGYYITFWRRNYFFNFSTPCI